MILTKNVTKKMTKSIAMFISKRSKLMIPENTKLKESETSLIELNMCSKRQRRKKTKIKT